MSSPNDWTRPERLKDLLAAATETLLCIDGRQGCRVDLPASGRLLVTGDLHDNLVNYERIVLEAQLDVPDHHLLLQELIHGPALMHGCDMSWRMIARTADLITRYPGQVHPILGNHENAQLTRSGVSKGAGNNVELFEDGLAMTFGEDWEDVAASLDRFFSAMPLAVRTASGLQCSHSIPDHAWMDRFDPGVLDRDLDPEDRLAPWGQAYMHVWGRRFDDAQLDALCEAWGIEAVVIGHVVVDMGSQRLGPRLVAFNSEDDAGAVWAVDLSRPIALDNVADQVRPIQMLASPEASW